MIVGIAIVVCDEIFWIHQREDPERYVVQRSFGGFIALWFS